MDLPEKVRNVIKIKMKALHKELEKFRNDNKELNREK